MIGNIYTLAVIELNQYSPVGLDCSISYNLYDKFV